MEKHDDLVGVLQSLYRWRKAIILTTLFAAILSVGIAMILPEYFKSTTTFYAASPDLNKPDRLFGDVDASYSYYGNDADIDRIRTIAQSGDLVEYMVDTFDLYTNYEIDPKNSKSSFYVNAQFLKSYEVTRTNYNAIQITVEDKEPVLAASMANTARRKIEKIAKSLIKESQKRQLSIYRSSIEDQNKSIESLESELAAVRKEYGPSVSGSKNEGSTKYETLKTRLEQLGTDQSKLEDKFNKLKSAYTTDVPSVHIIEEAKIPVIKSRPIRSILVISSTIAAFIFSLLGALLLDYYKGIDWKRVTE